MDTILSHAREQEKGYDWSGTAKSYGKALRLVPEQDFLRRGEVYERLGYAFYRLAMQAESVERFRERMREAVANYEKAKESYGRLGEKGKAPRMLRCDAMIAYVGYWLASEMSEKKRLIDECWTLTMQALKGFEEAQDAWEYGKTYNQLSISVGFKFPLEWDFKAREKTLREAAEHGEQAINFLSTFGDLCELARAYVKAAAYLEAFCFISLNLDERETYSQKALDYWLKASKLSEEIALLESLNILLGAGVILGGEGTEEALTNFKKALEYSRKTKEKFIVGCALDMLAYHTFWRALATENPDERSELSQRAFQYAEEAKHQFSPISYISPRGGTLWVEAPQAEYYFFLATFEPDLNKRRKLLEQAKDAASDQLRRAKSSGYPEIISLSHHVLGTVLVALAKIGTNSEEKKKLLENALVHRNETIRMTEKIEPSNYWNRGLMQTSLAEIKFGLADLAKDRDTKKNILQEAILDKETSLKLAIEDAAFFERRGSVPPLFAILGRWQYEYGGFLNRLYGFTGNKEHLRKALEAFEESAESYQKLNIKSRIAECHWKTARIYDDLGEYLKAAENFDIASNDYESAAEKIPQLKDFYQDHALYMQAWSEIEIARHHHRREEYGSAEEHFEKAANLHKSLRQWSYFAPNYSAWAKVEHAEDLSRKEQCEEALRAFEQAAQLFKETKKSLKTEFSKIESLDEKQMVTNMLKATELRHKYCTARIALEEGKILDKKGEHYSSSEKFASAAEAFEKISQALESEQERQEFKFIVNFSRAWQKMTRAEAEASPALYVEASQLFEEAKEFSLNEKAKMLALGHSRFCRTLEAGTKFADTRDPTMHTTALKYLEGAANYYMKAGFQKASEYAKATGLLFDAYVHMDNAKEESDTETKAKLYIMAEKVLQASAGAYMKAEHPEKREQVLRLLETVREERELALSLTEVLHAPSIVSTTTAFATPTPTHEEAVGLEKFENADVQANLITRRKDLKVGENLDLELELVNAGKGPALLIKIMEVIPEGFELVEKPAIYRVEDSYLNMKGKRLDPLKTEEVRLVLKPKVQGDFPLKPTILYADENGKYKTHKPEPLTITVKELGIKGWLKGER